MKLDLYMYNAAQEEKLLKMLAWMEWCGNIGHSTSFRVIFDGDGTAKIHCNFENEELQNKYNAIRKEIRDNYNNRNMEPEYFEFGI